MNVDKFLTMRIAQSRNSRAARREASPTVDINKSLLSAPRAESTVFQRDSILSERANAGVTKKQPKRKNLSRTQHQRQKKGMERAEHVMDQLEKKVSRSVNQGKTVKARKVYWLLNSGAFLELRPNCNVSSGRLG